MGLNDWKLKLRYGKMKTPYKHFVLLADCFVGNLIEEYKCSSENAIVSIKIWAVDGDQAAEIFQDIGRQIGFNVKDKIEIFDKPADQPPTDSPSAYGINFTPYDNE